MSTEIVRLVGTIGPEVTLTEEVPMVRQERWEELRRLWQQERVPIAELARRFELDRKTVRRCLRDPAWRPYQRSAPAETVLTTHAEYLRTRAPKAGTPPRSSSRSCASRATGAATRPRSGSSGPCERPDCSPRAL
jgi:hypothetical protein